MYKLDIFICMKTTVILKEDLLNEASRLTDIKGKTALIHAGLKALIAQASRRRLVSLGGTEKKLKVVSRRRSQKKS